MNVSGAFKFFLDTVLPPRCPVNGEIVPEAGAISTTAWKDLTFISDPKCACCGFPFQLDTGLTTDNLPTDFLCGDCLASPRPYDYARSVFTYNDASRSVVLAFKHGDKIHLHTTLVPLLVRVVADFITPETLIIPVPLHRLRLLKRRYNQAAILAQGIAKQTGSLYCPDALKRTKSTLPQGHKNAKDRHKNVAGAFSLSQKNESLLKNASVILVDDVFTTGATVEECCKILRTAGVKTITVATVARVTKNG